MNLCYRIMEVVTFLLIVAKAILYIGFKEIGVCYTLSSLIIVFLLIQILICRWQLLVERKENGRLRSWKIKLNPIKNKEFENE